MMNRDEAIKILEEYSEIDLSVVDKVLPGIGSESKKIDEAIKVAIEALKTGRNTNEDVLYDIIEDFRKMQAKAEIVAQLDAWDIGTAFKDVMLDDTKRGLPGSGYKAAYAFFSEVIYGMDALEEEPKEES